MKRIVEIAIFLGLSTVLWADQQTRHNECVELVKLLTAGKLESELRAQFLDSPQMKVLSEPARAVVAKYLDAEKITEEFASAYEASFSEDEIKALLKFYKSDVGAKSLERMPDVTARCAQIINKHVEDCTSELAKVVSPQVQGSPTP